MNPLPTLELHYRGAVHFDRRELIIKAHNDLLSFNLVEFFLNKNSTRVFQSGSI